MPTFNNDSERRRKAPAPKLHILKDVIRQYMYYYICHGILEPKIVYPRSPLVNSDGKLTMALPYLTPKTIERRINGSILTYFGRR